VDELARLHGRIRLASERALAAWYVRAVCMDRLDYWAIAKAMLRDQPDLIDASGGDYTKALRTARQRVGRQANHLLAKYANHGDAADPGTWIHTLMGHHVQAPDWSQRLVDQASKVLRSMGELIQGAVVRDESGVRREPLPPEDVITNAQVVSDYLEANNGTVPEEAAQRPTLDEREQRRRESLAALKRALAAARACRDIWDYSGNQEVRGLLATATTDLRAAAQAAGLELL
tara:strand:+ start:14933 stop:15628 length:696 start_codon:yes stop_codon:yes gene_type:complete